MGGRRARLPRGAGAAAGALGTTWPVRLLSAGLARSLAALGNTAAAREEYKKFLDAWSQADPDLAIVQQVKAEWAKIGT